MKQVKAMTIIQWRKKRKRINYSVSSNGVNYVLCSVNVVYVTYFCYEASLHVMVLKILLKITEKITDYLLLLNLATV